MELKSPEPAPVKKSTRPAFVDATSASKAIRRVRNDLNEDMIAAERSSAEIHNAATRDGALSCSKLAYASTLIRLIYVYRSTISTVASDCQSVQP